MTGPYDDILNLPHPVSAGHPPMAAMDRAAQFSPFAALTGYDAAIRETARWTEERMELDESAISALSERLHVIAVRLVEHPSITITYFQPDRSKCGGTYVTAAGVVKKMDEYRRIVTLTDGTGIPMDDIIGIEGAIFEMPADP